MRSQIYVPIPVVRQHSFSAARSNYILKQSFKRGPTEFIVGHGMTEASLPICTGSQNIEEGGVTS